MDTTWKTLNHRKRKRRRISDKKIQDAHLVLDPTLERDVALLSSDIFNELFAGMPPTYHDDIDHTKAFDSYYVALALKIPALSAKPDQMSWTILPVRQLRGTSAQSGYLESSVHVSPSSASLQPFLKSVFEAFPSKSPAVLRDTIIVHIIDVVPMPLDIVVVSIQEDVKDDSIADAVRSSFAKAKLVHSGVLLDIHHSRPSKTESEQITGKIEFCSPVSQGLLFPWTKIVITPRLRQKSDLVDAMHETVGALSNGVTAYHQNAFNENVPASRNHSEPPNSGEPTNKIDRKANVDWSSEISDQDQATDFSESDSDALGLDLPALPNGLSAGRSDTGSVTPSVHSFHTNGVSSPGSTLSESISIIGNNRQGRLFRACGLTSRVPDQCLHPIPPSDEDDEARIFADATALARLGCFSGDWVVIESVADYLPAQDITHDLTSSDGPNYEISERRVAKIYGLSEPHIPKHRYSAMNTETKSSRHIRPYENVALPLAYMSPLLLVNLGNPRAVRLMAVSSGQSRNSSQIRHQSAILTTDWAPPFAKEMDIYKLATPLATERSLDTAFFQALRSFFESKQRIVKTNDLIAITVDSDMAKATYAGITRDDDLELDKIDQVDHGRHRGHRSKIDVAWFKVGPVSIESQKRENSDDPDKAWGNVVMVKPLATRMSQKGSEIGRLPATVDNCWAYYLGLKRISPTASYGIRGFSAPPVSFLSSVRRRLRELISAATSPQAIHFKLPPVVILLKSTQRRIGKSTTATQACDDLGLHMFAIDAYDILSEGGSTGGDVNTAGVLEARAERVMACGPQHTAILIKHVDALTAERMATTLHSIVDGVRVLVATTSNIDKVPDTVRSLFTHEIEMTAPDEGEREGLLQGIIQNSELELAPDVDLASVALKTAALVASDLADVVERATVARQERLEQLASSANTKLLSTGARIAVLDLQIAGGFASRCVTRADFDTAVDAGRKNFADAIGAPKIPNVSWDDVGGLTNVKDAVMETIQLPLERPELFAKGMKKRSGILFYGPPGTGKTLLAKAIATEFSLNFFSVKGPELLNMYIGESEANVRRVFQRARDARPCVVFFDELDSVAPKRGNQGDSGGVMDRIVSQLLAELDGMSNGEDGSGGGGGVFVIGATNRPDLLDQALLRPGRFDKMLYLGVSDTHDKQLTILEALTRKFALHPHLSLRTVASKLPFTYTGADLYALCSDAMLKAITRRASSVDMKVRTINRQRAASIPPLHSISVAYFFDHLAGPEDTQVVVELQDFEQATRELVPSVSARELEHYDSVRESFEKGEEKSATVTKQALRSHVKANARIPSRISRSQDVNATEDGFTLRTQALALDDPTYPANTSGYHVVGNHGAGEDQGREKGKAKAPSNPTDQPSGFGNAAVGDEAMYDE